MTILISLVLIYTSSFVLGGNHKDEIKSLPGYDGEIDFKQYSGYLKIDEDKFFHYWFVESQRSPPDDPVLLWLNGGPGCSSLLGCLTELGPFLVKQDGMTLHKNVYSWNKVANVIFLETPAGVGFSYSVSQNWTADDKSTAEDNYIALQRFFEKFPDFKKNEFYASGESYAGVYIPTLSEKILDGKVEINFKGFAIGNGCVDWKMIKDSSFFFAYYHGIFGDDTWEELTGACCEGTPSQKNCEFTYELSAECRRASRSVKSMMQNKKLNTYNLYHKCMNSSQKMSRYAIDRMNFLAILDLDEDDNDEKEVLTESGGVGEDELQGTPCQDSSSFESYLNQKSVREALHVSDKVKKYESCNDDIFLNQYTKTYRKMGPIVKKLLRSGKLRGMIYAGDVDMVCNFMGDQWFARSLKLAKEKPYRTWEYKDQIAGYVIDYKNLTFLTVKGSGHMVPEDKPGPALKIITNFLSNTEF